MTQWRIPCLGDTRHLEDRLLDQIVLDTIMAYHGWEPRFCMRHVVAGYPDTVELDAYILAETPRGAARTVEVELKEHDFAKAVTQAIARLEYANTVYVVMSRLTLTPMNMEYLRRAIANGVGIVLYEPENCKVPRLILPARPHSCGEECAKVATIVKQRMETYLFQKKLF